MKTRLIAACLALLLLLGACPGAGAAWEPMEPGEGCVAYIIAHEGFSATPYADSSGWYIGYGVACNPADYPDGITEEEAEELLREKLALFADSVNAFLRRYDVAVTQGQFDALCAMTYNFGPSWLNTANRLPSYLVNGVDNYTDEEIVSAFAAWCHIGGQVSTGLLKRRIVEAKMFLYDDYDMDSSDWTWLILDANGGSVRSDVACFRAGERYGALPEARREGYAFAGWQTADGSLLREDDTALSPVSVRAIWAPPGEEPEPEEPDEEEEPILTDPGADEEPILTDPGADEEPILTDPGAEEEPILTDPGAADEPEETEGYPDVLPGTWFYEYVTQLSERGVISGFDDGLFRPQEDVSWGQALKLVLLSAGYKEQPREEDGHWASGYRSFAIRKGFLDEDAAEDLDESILRSEIADLAARALELDTTDTGERPFADSEQGALLALYREDILLGSMENGLRLFRGGDCLTRAEISAVLVRVAAYVDRTLILFNNYRIPINYDLPFNPYDPDAFHGSGASVRYDDPAYRVHYGIDVSYYQKEIDWEAVAEDGVEFAILRVGYRGCSEGELFLDDCFYTYLEGAQAAGLDVGLYFFSQALNADEAREEAEYLLEAIDGYDIQYPIAFDWEPLGYAYSRTRAYDYSVLSECANAFCDAIEEAGYPAMIYMNPSFAYLRYDLAQLRGRTIWLAHYTDRTNYFYDFQLWQYSSSGSISGIEGRVDVDIAFFDWQDFW